MVMATDMEIKIEPLGAANEKEWDALVKIAQNGHLMARPGFFRYHAGRFVDASLFIRRGRRPLGVLPANRDGDTLWSHQGVSFGGLILHPRTRMDQVGEAVRALLDHLRSQGIKRMMYRPAPHPYHLQPREEDIYWLEQAGARIVDTKLHSMVMCGSDAAVRSKTWGRDIRRSAGAGVRVRTGKADELGTAWSQVERNLAGHDQKPVHSFDDIALLMQRFPAEILLVLAESAEDDYLAGQILFRSGRTLTSMYLGDTDQGRDLWAGSSIIDYILNDPENAGFWCDLGQWCDTSTREVSDSLLHYKEGIGGRLIQRHTWQLDLDSQGT